MLLPLPCFTLTIYRCAHLDSVIPVVSPTSLFWEQVLCEVLLSFVLHLSSVKGRHDAFRNEDAPEALLCERHEDRD